MTWWLMAWSKSLPTSWRTFQRLTTADRWTFIGACLLLPITAVAFRGLGFRRWQATLERWSPRCQVKRQSPALPRPWKAHSALEAQAYRTAWLVTVAGRLVARCNSCLSRSLVLWWLLRWRGLAGELRIGVRKHRDQLQAHAWVEYRDRVLNDRGDDGFPFVSFDRAIVPIESGSA
jgi:hypothetical protein